MFPDSAESHPFTRLVLVLATPQSAALIVTAFLLVATMYILSYRAQANRTEKRWDEVCRQVLRDRDELAHKVLGRASGEAADVDGILQVRCCRLQVIGLSPWVCGFVGFVPGRWTGW